MIPYHSDSALIPLNVLSELQWQRAVVLGRRRAALRRGGGICNLSLSNLCASTWSTARFISYPSRRLSASAWHEACPGRAGRRRRCGSLRGSRSQLRCTAAARTGSFRSGGCADAEPRAEPAPRRRSAGLIERERVRTCRRRRRPSPPALHIVLLPPCKPCASGAPCACAFRIPATAD